MRTIILLSALFCSGILSAQAPPFVDDWEGAPDQMKIRANDKTEYVAIKPVKTNCDKQQSGAVALTKKKAIVKNRKKSVSTSEKKRAAKTSAK